MENLKEVPIDDATHEVIDTIMKPCFERPVVTANFPPFNENFEPPKANEKAVKVPNEGFTVKVYVAHGYYEYTVKTMEAAMAHGQAIMSSGVYRRSTVEGAVEFHKVYKVKVVGDGLASEYPDVFRRT